MAITNPALASAVDAGSWETRIKEAAYTSPSGKRIRFNFEDVGREVTKRTSAFEFPGVDEAYVQDNGFGSRRYPLRCIFVGPNHDIEATQFEGALLEHGVGLLEHPFYGPRSEAIRGRRASPFSVVPFGDITRRDDLRTAANQTIVEVTFWTTLRAIYPGAVKEPKNEILSALDSYNTASAEQFANSTNLANITNQATSKATIRKFLKDVSAALQSVSNTVGAVNKEFREAQSVVNEGLDVFVGQPLLLAQQISNLLTAPGRALSGISSRLQAYVNLANSIFGSEAARPADRLIGQGALAFRTSQITNDFHIARHFAEGTLAGAILAVSEATFTTKPEALAAAESIVGVFDSLVSVRDEGYETLQTFGAISASAQVDTGDSYQALQQATALVVGFLIEISFSLVPERRLVLDRARSIVDVCAEVYGVVDEKLDFLINSNALTGDEILELPAGKTILYYAA